MDSETKNDYAGEDFSNLNNITISDCIIRNISIYILHTKRVDDDKKV